MKRALMVFLFFIGAFGWTQSDFERAHKIYEEYENNLITLSDRYFHDGQFHEVISILRLRMGMNPSDEQLVGDLVWMLRNVDDYEQAYWLTISFKKDNPNSLGAIMTEAQFYQVLKLWSKIPPILEPVCISSGNRNAYVLLAGAYEYMGMYSEALRVQNARLQEFPDDEAAKRNIQKLKEILGIDKP